MASPFFAVNGGTIEKNKEDKETFQADPVDGLCGSTSSGAFLTNGLDLPLIGPGLKPNIRPKRFQAKQMSDFSS